MVHLPHDGRGVSLSNRSCRSRRVVTMMTTFMLALGNLSLSTIVMAQETTPKTPPTSTIPSTSPVILAPTNQLTSSPFRPVTDSPMTASPVSAAPVSDAPTASPTLKPVTLDPTASPTELPSMTKSPSIVPSFSVSPSSLPSNIPTNYPTVSPRPSNAPSFSSMPSSPPSSSLPTMSPTPMPSTSPVLAPTGSPSTNTTKIVKRNCAQILVVEQAVEFGDVEQGIFETIMRGYTENFGHMVGEPQIVTTCKITEQDLAGRRNKWRGLLYRFGIVNSNRGMEDHSLRKVGIGDISVKEGGRNLQQSLLVMSFTIQYESRYGYEVEGYPILFQSYINSNLEFVTEDMQRFLPVIEVRTMLVYKEPVDPTAAPTALNDKVPTDGPTFPARPSTGPSSLPTVSVIPSMVPTYSPVITMAPTDTNIAETKSNTIVVLAGGLVGAAVIMFIFIWYMRRANSQKEEERKKAAANANNNNNAGGGSGNQMPADWANSEDAMKVEGVATGLARNNASGNNDQHSAPQYEMYSPETYDEPSRPSVADSVFSNPSMVSGGGSFSSNLDNDNEGGVQLETLQDEFDNYKNLDLEYMRDGVEQSVYGAEGMMSLAMTRALMEDEEADVKPTWGGAEDPESIEANGLCETNDWLRKNEHSTVDGRNQFFQEILNRMVITVRRGMISPSDGTRAIHCCAAMLGLKLEKELPSNVLLVHGMAKKNDLSLGRQYLEEAFKEFGDIERVAIAPSNKGFGFVRFVSPKSVQRALECFKKSEIEVQDVSVMIKSLKADAPS